MREWMNMDSPGQVSGLSCWTCHLLLFSFSLKTKSTHRNMKILKCTPDDSSTFFFLKKNLFLLRFDSLIGVDWNFKMVAFGTIWVSVGAVPSPSPWSSYHGQIERRGVTESTACSDRGSWGGRAGVMLLFSKHHFWLSPWHFLVCFTLRGLRLTDFFKTMLKIRQN